MSEITKKSESQKGSEAEVERFRKNLGPFVVAAEARRMAMLFTDATEPHNPIIFANGIFLFLPGHDREEVLGKSFNFLLARRKRLTHPPVQKNRRPLKFRAHQTSGTK